MMARIEIPMRVRDAVWALAERRAAAVPRKRNGVPDEWRQLLEFHRAYDRLLREWREADGRPAWLEGRGAPPEGGG